MPDKLNHSRVLSSPRREMLVFILAVSVLFSAGRLWAADGKAAATLARYRVFSLRHIPARKGKDYLAQAGIGTVSQLPGTNTLLVTASQRDLTEATAIMNLVDTGEQFAVKRIPLASPDQNLPTNEEIAARVGNISIGTFLEPPSLTVRTRAIVDVRNGAVIVVAPVGVLDKIVSAVRQPQSSKAQIPQPGTLVKVLGPDKTGRQKSKTVLQMLPEGANIPPELTGPPDANKAAENELFNRLLESLASAEQATAARAKQPAVPNEPNAVAAPPQPNAPARPAVSPQPQSVAARAFTQAELAAIVKRLKVLEAEVKRKPVPEKGTVEIAQPNEVNVPAPKVPYKPAPFSDGNDILKLNLPPSLTITEFLDYMGKNLHLDYLYDPAKIKGNVTLKLGGRLAGSIRRKDLYPLLESVLHFNGFVMSRRGNLVLIVPEIEADRIDSRIVRTEKDKLKPGDVIITRFFKLKHIDTASARNLLTGMQLGVKIRDISQTGTIIVTGYAYRMPRIEEILKVIDKPGKPKKFRFRQLKYTMAKNLAPKIKTLAEQMGTISVTIAAQPAAPSTTPPSRGRTTRTPRSLPRKQPAAAPKAIKPTVYLDADERTNRILMIGLDEQLAVVGKLIDSLDVQQQDLRTLRLYEIQHVDADEVRKKLVELGIISGSTGAARTTTRGSVSRTTKTGPRPPTATASTAGKKAQSLLEEPQVVIIESTNSLLVNATAEQHARIAMIIGYVDSETEAASIPYVVYQLENQDPEDLAGVLNQLIQETVTTKGAKGAKIERPVKKMEEDITIIADPKTYSLIVYASKKNQQWIGSLIKKLDQYRPQVLLDVTLVEITKNDAFTLDLDIISSFPDLTEASGQITPYITDFSAGERQHYVDLQSKGGNATGFYGDKHIQALLSAVQTKSYGRVLARPKLLVNDNEEGTITTERTTTIAREKTDIVSPPTGTTTSATSVSFDTFTEGVNLAITPHISQGDQLQLKISMKRTDFGDLTKKYSIQSSEGTKTGPIPPDLLSSNVETVVTVPDGKTIILGGLEKLNQTKGGTKVPVLGDIPLLGGLFRSTANTDTQSRLYVFVKAHILRPGEKGGLSDTELVSRRNREKFERYEEEMQRYEDWPGIKPKPMDPLRVLEAD